MTTFGNQFFITDLQCTTINGNDPSGIVAQDLSSVLAAGNDANNSNIDNVNTLTATSLSGVSFLNNVPVNTFLNAQNLADVLTLGSNAGNANIEDVNFYKGKNMTLTTDASAAQFNGNILVIQNSIDARYSSNVSTILLPNLPTSDPLVANQLWLDSSSNLKISAGGGGGV